ncbi:MAG TPA: tRNA uridine(34) 5-carboxymethylaminomethyl modification radical SAM/GNAT enzyme Elp3 [Candidatus Udaeobacter sp.]|nr:tRNA uridine(34) 5-carboxymethylaminomethyl modification radical SAM/GNAT enzyme Elp3 [Candidatus Udaeobacter sp.]
MSITDSMIKQLLANLPQTAGDFGDTLRNILRQEKNHQTNIPTKPELLKSYHKLLKQHKIKKSPALEKILMRRAVRSLSGVSIITVLTKPFPCPGKCIYCPTEARMPKSYLADEPAAARALGLAFDPYQQVFQRLLALKNNGHPTDKVELIIKGGTWNSYPIKYQYWFIARCFEACNNAKFENSQVDEMLPLDELRKLSFKIQKRNETAKHRIIGLTIETRPDFINKGTIAAMREMGTTRLELGVQHTNEKILQITKRGHGVGAVKQATRMLKDYGFKVDFHLMPQLPGATPKTDLKMMLEIFDEPQYRPDMIKIYPCTVIKTSELYDWLKRGEYKTYSDRELINILKKFKAKVPRYVRISRLIRDIPGHHIQAGNTMTNLRQVIQDEMKKEGLKCNCLRCREVGHQHFEEGFNHKPKLFVDEYEASGGKEYFLSFEDKNRDIVYAFCRLRVLTKDKTKEKIIQYKGLPSEGISAAALDKMGYPAFIRELHTYGQLINIGKKSKGASQHIGMGRKLIAEAEKICRQNKAYQLAVISGVGVREYYKKFGYKLENTYMVKNLKK